MSEQAKATRWALGEKPTVGALGGLFLGIGVIAMAVAGLRIHIRQLHRERGRRAFEKLQGQIHELSPAQLWDKAMDLSEAMHIKDLAELHRLRMIVGEGQAIVEVASGIQACGRMLRQDVPTEVAEPILQHWARRWAEATGLHSDEISHFVFTRYEAMRAELAEKEVAPWREQLVACCEAVELIVEDQAEGETFRQCTLCGGQAPYTSPASEAHLGSANEELCPFRRARQSSA